MNTKAKLRNQLQPTRARNPYKSFIPGLINEIDLELKHCAAGLWFEGFAEHPLPWLP